MTFPGTTTFPGATTFTGGNVGPGSPVGGPTPIPVTGQPYVVTYYPALNGQPVDVVSVDRVELYATPARTGTPVVTVTGPAARTALGRYAFAPAVMPADGVYFTVVTFTAPGGAVLADSNDTLRVYAFSGGFAPSGLVTLDQVKRHLGMESTTRHDDELLLYIDGATGVIEEWAGAVLPRTVTETVHGSVLSSHPVMSVLSVTRGGVVFDGPLTVRSESGIVDGLPYDSVVTYTAGRTTIPAAVQRATLRWISWSWRREHGGSDTFMPGGEDATVPGLGVRGIEAEVRALLGPYLVA